MKKITLIFFVKITTILTFACGQYYALQRPEIQNSIEHLITYRYTSTTRVYAPKSDPDSFFFGK